MRPRSDDSAFSLVAIISGIANNCNMSNPQTVICTFRVREDALSAFLTLLGNHWPTLRRLELVTDTEEQLFSGVDHQGDEPVIVSIFEWANEEASILAHSHPDVAEIWEAMDPLCEARHGLPSMEFPHFRPLTLTS